ncbi:MAG TPA: O-antigen ligase family protein, partial [Tepidisphaeraceae bacterium]|nr:O-antigen ligase family protein [Tepidisphaeraceae bacterium]
MTSVESLRAPWDVTPGGTAFPRAPGPATSLIMDLLATLPALLVLARRSIDKDFRLTPRWSHLPMLALGAWVMLSTTWASDTFAALVHASNWLAGLALMWAFSQLVRSWVRLRIVASVGFGLLLVLVAQSVLYRVIEVPETIRYWNTNRDALLKERNWEPGSFQARQFEHKITSGELPGFFASPNTFAAVGVMLLFVSAGIGVQKTRDGDGAAWLALSAVAIAAAGWVIVEARSKTAGATPVLGVSMLLAIALWHDRLRRHATPFYWLGVAAFFLAAAAIVGHGLYHHGLFPGHFSNSLDFRWKYWMAAAQIFKQHPIRGVGWDSFGQYYLAARLPEASEEVKDPHNFLVRVFVETGMVGGVLVIAWMLRLWWELTRPSNDTNQPSTESCGSATVGAILWIAVLGITISVIANVDFTQSIADVALELMRRVLYLMVLAAGSIAGTMLSPHRRELDGRAAPWLLYFVLVALGLFLIHNLIDFSMFEVGPLFLFLMLVGAALGVAPATARAGRSRAWAIALLIVAMIGWLIAAARLVGPVAVAEQSAFDADEAIRTAPADQPAQLEMRYRQAATDLSDALARVPWNTDYALRAAKAWLGAGQVDRAEDMLAAA